MYVFCSGEGGWCVFGWKNGKRRKEVGKQLLVWEDLDGANDEGLIWLRMRSFCKSVYLGGLLVVIWFGIGKQSSVGLGDD